MLKMLSRFAVLILALAIVQPVFAAPMAGPVPLQSGPYDPGNGLGNINTLIQAINSNIVGSYCTVTGASAQTCNGQRGIVTTGTLSTAGATNAAYVINNTAVTAASLILCTDQGYSGTLVTNGYPVIMSCVPGAGTITVNITNTHATNAMSGTVQIGFAVLN